MNTLEDYEKKFKEALRADAPYFAQNKDLVHAEIIINEAFKWAGSNIRVLSHELSWLVYGSADFLKIVDGFLAKPNHPKLEVIVESMIDDDHPFLAHMRKSDRLKDQVEVFRLREKPSHNFNFMIVDDKGFRFEPDREVPEAIVSFHGGESDGEIINELNSIFNRLTAKSERILPTSS